MKPRYLIRLPEGWRPGVDIDLRLSEPQANVNCLGSHLAYTDCPGGHPFRIRRPGPLRISLELSNSKQELYWTTNGSFDLLVSNRVRKLLTANGTTGCEFRPIFIENVNKDLVSSDYWELSAASFVSVDPISSRINDYEVCEACGTLTINGPHDGLIFHENSDPGTDIVGLNELPNQLFVSERILELFVNEELKPCIFWHQSRIPFDSDCTGAVQIERDKERISRVH